MDGEQPIIERFSVGADGTLTLNGELSFANYGMPYWTIDAWGNTMVSPTQAYFTNPGDGSLIVWNPTSMEIVREVPLPLQAPAGLELQSAPAYLRGDPDWQFRYADFADGREGAVLRYLGDGQALADIFHHERTTITSATDPSELGESSNW